MFRNNTGKEFPVSSSIVLETEEGVKVSLETQTDTGEEQTEASGKIQPVISGLQLWGMRVPLQFIFMPGNSRKNLFSDRRLSWMPERVSATG